MTIDILWSLKSAPNHSMRFKARVIGMRFALLMLRSHESKWAIKIALSVDRSTTTMKKKLNQFQKKSKKRKKIIKKALEVN